MWNLNFELIHRLVNFKVQVFIIYISFCFILSITSTKDTFITITCTHLHIKLESATCKSLSYTRPVTWYTRFNVINSNHTKLAFFYHFDSLMIVIDWRLLHCKLKMKVAKFKILQSERRSFLMARKKYSTPFHWCSVTEQLILALFPFLMLCYWA